jgi:hypothetical protein
MKIKWQQQKYKHIAKRTNKKKLNQLRIINFKHKSLKISLHLQIPFAAETHRAEGQWLEEQLNIQSYACYEQKLFLELRVEHLATLQIFIKNKASEWWHLMTPDMLCLNLIRHIKYHYDTKYLKKSTMPKSWNFLHQSYAL